MLGLNSAKLKEINDYIEKYKGGVNRKYKPAYHMSPAMGWMNDPNGLIYFKGKYHLFYQSTPFDTKPGTMYWGHFVSDDLISFKDVGVAIAPSAAGENIFSGGAVEIGGKLVVMYTLHICQNGVQTEDIWGAISSDGKNFKPLGKLFDNEKLPENLSREDFRDPCPAIIDGKLYVFVGGKDEILNKGVIVVLGGDIDNLEYKFTIGPFDELGEMGECPSYANIDGHDVLLASGVRVPERHNSFININSSTFIVGKIDFGRGEMRVKSIREIDKGDAFYAPQFISGISRHIMVGWLENWSKRYPTHEEHHGWTGAFTIPRELKIVDGELVQTPVTELDKYMTDGAEGLSRGAAINFSFSGEGKIKIVGDNGELTIGSDGRIFVDTERANNGNGSIWYSDGVYDLPYGLALLDNSGIEVFVCGGKEAISSRLYLDGELRLVCEGGARVESVKKIGVD